MSVILADVGGTNLRFAVATDGAIDATRTLSLKNDCYDSFYAALAHFLTVAQVAQIDGFTVAVAGPVSGHVARLTNRDWTIDTHQLMRNYPGTFAKILNDLSALGYALDTLSPADVRPVLKGSRRSAEGDMRLVLGVGTGLNVSPVLRHAGCVTCLKAEAGLASLPTGVFRHLQAYVGPENARGFTIVEDALSGRGLARFHHLATGSEMRGEAIMHAAARGEAQAVESVSVFARMLGDFVQDLNLQYFPTGGIYLAGGVVRGLLDTACRTILLDTLQATQANRPNLCDIPVSVIVQDTAALIGCLHYAQMRD
ncbi:MAG: glucokinase [Sulfitobacter sp.]